MASAATDSVYTLTGFGEFLEWRRIRFADPLPKIRVCQLCGVVAAVARLLPCTHVLCESCENKAEEKGRKCPVDGYSFQGEDVQNMPFPRRDIDERVVHCLNDTGEEKGCRFRGKLAELQMHFTAHCMHGGVQCSKCKAQVSRKEVFDHYTSCEGEDNLSLANTANGSTVTFDATEAGRLAASLRDIRDGINDALKGGPNSGVKMGELQCKVVSLSSFLSILDPAGESVEVEVPSPPPSPCEDDIGNTGSIVCKFQGLDSMRKDRDPVLWLNDPCTLDGYTFYLALHFERQRGKISNVGIVFKLTTGVKDDFVEWPFAKQVRFSLVRPNNDDKGMEVPVKMSSKTDAKCFKKPDENELQKSIFSEKIKWKDIEKKGLICDDSILVKVYFE